MTQSEMTLAIQTAKKQKKATWAAIAEAVGLSPVYVTSACLGQNTLDRTAADKLVQFLSLPPKVAEALTEFANKGETSPTIPKPGTILSTPLAQVVSDDEDYWNLQVAAKGRLLNAQRGGHRMRFVPVTRRALWQYGRALEARQRNGFHRMNERKATRSLGLLRKSPTTCSGLKRNEARGS